MEHFYPFQQEVEQCFASTETTTLTINKNMKNLQSTIENAWTEISKVQLTAEQEALEPKERFALLKDLRESAPTTADATIATAKYLEVKPTLKEEDVYQLIGIDLQLNGQESTGILNCRVNGEHLQIRF